VTYIFPTVATPSPTLPAATNTAAAHLVLINPPPLAGRTNERTFSGGIGVSRALKPFEREEPTILPIDFLYLAAVAEKAGCRVTLVDLLIDRFSGSEATRVCLERIGPARGAATWVGVRLSMPSLAQDLAFADQLKAQLPDARVFVFGAAIMATIDHWIGRTRVDYVCFGEPEAFFDHVLTAAHPETVPGLVVPSAYVPLTGRDLYDEDKNTARNARWIKVTDIRALPRPAWHLLDMSRYSTRGVASDVGVYVQASRGCPIGCSMCPYVLIEGLPWRKNDVDAVVDEIDYLNRQFGIYRVRFRDPNFGFNRQYARALAEALIARGVRLEATVETSLEVLEEETLERLYQAGIRTITTGVETNDAACMESIGQRITINARLGDRVRFCQSVGFRLYGTYCLGMPEETWETVEKTWRFANELDIESGFTVLTPFPGTPMYWRSIAEGLLPREMQFSHWNSYTATVRTYALTTTDLDMARWWARMETIIPYRRKRAATVGRLELARFYVRHAPHYFWRQVCRGYVWFRKRWPSAPWAIAAIRSGERTA
jgi:magnesium-protoporphyrin IX monomethyl ester (oxidative) cyclase